MTDRDRSGSEETLHAEEGYKPRLQGNQVINMTSLHAPGHLSDLHSEDIDSDSIMTDEIEEESEVHHHHRQHALSGVSGSSSIPGTGTIDPSSLIYSSTSGSPVASTSGTSGLQATATTAAASTSTAEDATITPATTSTRPSATRLASTNIHPAGPVCEYGDRLGYTYFSKPVPTADDLNTVNKHTQTFWLTVDNDLTYLSFFRDTGPVGGYKSVQLSICRLIEYSSQLNVACLYRFCLHLHDLLEVSRFTLEDGTGSCFAVFPVQIDQAKED